MRRAPDVGEIGFTPLAMADLPLLRRWLNRPAVAEWWDGAPWSADAVAAKYAPRVRGETPVRCFLIRYGGAPIGYIQAYPVAAYPDEWGDAGVEAGAWGVDLFIGSDRHRHRGLGAPILRAFARGVVFGACGAAACVIDPSPRNRVAIRAYEKAGFRHLRTIPMSGAPDGAYLLRLTPADLAIGAAESESR
ncbi:MAG TPA: GNAT family N-acetyltransferase [Thermomicrobiales bacterium]|nr:GNAT family N-acetyltransferase [Thermomicrobiales bacterium]